LEKATRPRVTERVTRLARLSVMAHNLVMFDVELRV
jgi:hypothetical protein